MTKNSPTTFATVGANALQETALQELLQARGLLAQPLLTFSSSATPDALAHELEESGVVHLPLEREALSRADAVLLYSGDDAVRETVEGWAKADNFWLLDMAEEAPGPWASPGADAQALRGAGPRLAVPSQEAWCTAALLGAASAFARGPALLHAFRPAAAKGEAGIRELFLQSAEALNFHSGPEEVFNRTLAFNLFPDSPSPAQSENFAQCVRALGGGEVSRVVFQAPLFHGAVLSLCLPVSDPSKAAKSAAAGLKAKGFTAMRGESWPGGLEAPKGKGVRFRVTGMEPGILWVYFVYDETTAGRTALGVALLATLCGVI